MNKGKQITIEQTENGFVVYGKCLENGAFLFSVMASFESLDSAISFIYGHFEEKVKSNDR